MGFWNPPGVDKDTVIDVMWDGEHPTHAVPAHYQDSNFG